MNLVQRFIPVLPLVFKRFPIPVILAVVLFVFEIDSYRFDLFTDEVTTNVEAAFFASLAGHLLGEGRGKYSLLWAILLGCLAGCLVYFGSFFQTSRMFLFGGMLPLLMVAPFLHRGVSQGAVWLFNLRLGLAFLLALLVGFVVGLGLSSVIAGLDYLFGVKFNNRYYDQVWHFAVILAGPIYGLTLVPKNLSEEIDLASHKNSLVERGISVLVNYLLVPLVLVYALILHAYAVKIGTFGSLPKGQIGTIVSLFAIGGTVTWLLGWPWREQGTKLLRMFMQGWFWLLPVPAVLLSIAIFRRISDYGVTPDRYGIVLVAIWTILVFVYLLMRRNKADIRSLLASIAALLLLGSFGPQGAFGTTSTSQIVQLKNFLEEKGFLRNGKLADLNLSVPYTDRVRDIIRQLEWVGKMTPDYSDKSPPTPAIGTAFDDALLPYLQFKSSWKQRTLISTELRFSAQVPLDQHWPQDTRLIGPIHQYRENTQKFGTVTVAVVNDNLELNIGGSVQTPIRRILDFVKANVSPNGTDSPPLTYEIDEKTSLLITEFSGDSGNLTKIENMTFWIVRKE
jgi:Domain of unknown function (DUF4153)